MYFGVNCAVFGHECFEPAHSPFCCTLLPRFDSLLMKQFLNKYLKKSPSIGKVSKSRSFLWSNKVLYELVFIPGLNISFRGYHLFSADPFAWTQILWIIFDLQMTLWSKSKVKLNICISNPRKLNFSRPKNTFHYIFSNETPVKF